MEKKSKFLEVLDATYQKILATEKELNEGFGKVNPEDKTDKLNLGGKMLMLSQLNTELLNTINLYLDVMEGKVEDFSKDVKEYYLKVEELKKPVSESDSEDIKKIKDYIKNYGKENGN